MTAKPIHDITRGQDITNALKSWVMVALTFLFVFLYGAALLGWIRPLADERVVSRLEPIIFVIIGYYFGRLPSQQNEKMLKDEINRQTQRADAAQHAKEQSQQAREALDEKIKNVRAALASSAPGLAPKAMAESLQRGEAVKEEALRHSVTAAINILDS
ncbi:MAG TPA: hypothetical protein VJ464_15395 [Blastocatellia bacterium]|nr:hypothetical protein [Blastocatellia bacterium]